MSPQTLTSAALMVMVSPTYMHINRNKLHKYYVHVNIMCKVFITGSPYIVFISTSGM